MGHFFEPPCTNVISTVACKVILRTRVGKCILCHMKLAQEGKSWKAQNLRSLPHSKISRSKSKQNNLCSNNWAKLHCYPHFPSFTPIKPRSGCHHLSSNLDRPWSWLAVGNGLPCNDFDWPIVSNLCSLLSLFVLNKGVSFFSCILSCHNKIHSS